MPHSPQAKKRQRQNEKARLHNKSQRSALRTQIKKFETALESGNVEQAETELRLVTKGLDKAAKVNLIHKNMCSRKKAQLAHNFNALKAAPPKA